ncbi:MAG: hypothetical protein IK001_04035, partial [Lachnospiraceae bacterium]|nr:hypothetical protein [Lachnospiraceae bacterium]
MNILVRNLSLSGKPYYVIVIYPTNILFNMGQYKGILIPAVSIGDELLYVEDDSLYGPVADYITNKKTHGYRIFSF